MSLKTTKAITLTGQSLINGQAAVYLTATISSDGTGGSNISQSTGNQDLYEANRKEVRADISEFQDAVWDVEDELDKEEADTETTSTSTSESAS